MLQDFLLTLPPDPLSVSVHTLFTVYLLQQLPLVTIRVQLALHYLSTVQLLSSSLAIVDVTFNVHFTLATSVLPVVLILACAVYRSPQRSVPDPLSACLEE